MNAPRTGISRGNSGSTVRPGTAAPATGKTKKGTSAADVADAFARGSVTLGTALGITLAQRDAMRHRAFALMGEQRLDLAEPLLEGLVALDPFDAWTLTALGGLKLDTGDVALARKLLDKAVEVTPSDITARALRAEARAKMGEVTAARDDLKKLEGADINLPAVKRARGLAIALQGATDGVALPASGTTKAPASKLDASGRKSRARLR
jgi:predicted Zn-dependent protease